MDLVIVALAFAWVPTFVGTVRLWSRYRRVQASPGSWLLQLFAVIATLLTPVVMWISFASSLRLLGSPPLENGALYSAISALLVAAVVPLIEVRIEAWRHGKVPDPSPPEFPDNKKSEEKKNGNVV